MNTWPNGDRRALTQSQHEEWNSFNYPGTRQLCILCDEPTGRCEEDSIYLESELDHEECIGPLCEDCAENIPENK